VKPVWTARADYDADAVWEHIAADNLDAADRIVERLRSSADRLTDHPLFGRKGRDPGTREMIVSGAPYILIYRLVGNAIEILRVLHGKQQWPPDLDDR
jgi:toxin ParE1/3/4